MGRGQSVGRPNSHMATTQPESARQIPATGSGAPLPRGCQWLVIAWGVWLALALLKWGNPVVLDRLIDPPGPWMEWLIQPWPVRWGQFAGAALVIVTVLWGGRVRGSIPWVPAVLIGGWWIWQEIAAQGSVDRALTQSVIPHFRLCLATFIAGFLVARRGGDPAFSCWIILGGYLWVLLVGFDQHYGSLQATREAFYRSNPNWQTFPAEFIKKINSDRVFATLVYPNALAGVLLLLGPGLMRLIWDWQPRRVGFLKTLLLAVLIYGSAACLYWSGSKSGWLIALGMGGVALLHVPGAPRLKLLLVGVVIALGLTAFGIKFRSYFAKGATSVSARVDYWTAATGNAREHPVFGTGPGTFSKIYGARKRPESEMAKLAHNDFLQQASDSGWVGALLYSGFWFVSLVGLYRYSRSSGLAFALWIGLLGWGVQSVFEFGLYIPALAWNGFWLWGGLWGAFSASGGGGDSCRLRVPVG